MNQLFNQAQNQPTSHQRQQQNQYHHNTENYQYNSNQLTQYSSNQDIQQYIGYNPYNNQEQEQNHYQNQEHQQMFKLPAYRKVFKTNSQGQVYCFLDEVKSYQNSLKITRMTPLGKNIKKIVEMEIQNM